MLTLEEKQQYLKYSGIVLIALIILIVVAYFSGIKPSDTLKAANPLTIPGKIIDTGSMRPTLYQDSELEQEVYAGNDLLCGHLYVFKNNLSMTGSAVHRLVYETRDGLLYFKGDNNADFDAPVTKEHILYEVVGVNYK